MFAFYDSGKGGAVKAVESLTTVSADQKVVVYKLSGTAVITKSSSPKEAELKIGDEIQMGDRIFTEKGASLSISFDERRLNTVSIPSGSEAVFTSIKPVSIRLKNGSVFSSVDGLAEGSTWEVTTPAAVAAVRGTQFEVEYSEASGEFSAMTYDDDNDKKSSAVELKPVAGGEAVKITEGRQLSFARGQIPDQKFIQKLTTDRIQRGKKFKKEVAGERKRISEKKAKDETKNGPQGPGGPGAGNGPGGAKGEKLPIQPNTFKPLEPLNNSPNLIQNRDVPQMPGTKAKEGLVPRPVDQRNLPGMPPRNGNQMIQPSQRKPENQNRPQQPPAQPPQKRNVPPPKKK